MKLTDLFRKFVSSEEALATTEYAIMLALIVLACVGSISGVGGKVADVFTRLDSGLPTCIAE